MGAVGYLDVFSHFFGALSVAIAVSYLLEIKEPILNPRFHIITITILAMILWEILEGISYYYTYGHFHNVYKPWYMITYDFTLLDFIKDFSSGITGLIFCIKVIV